MVPKHILGVSALVLLFGLTGVRVSAQVGPCATPIGPNLPDLIVDGAVLKAQMFVTEETFGPNSCTVVEGCVSAPGTHLLLRFTSSTPNIGASDLIIGDPSQCLGDLFRFSECHAHLHLQQSTAHRLWAPEGFEKWRRERDLSRPTNSGRNEQLLEQAQRQGELIVGRKQDICWIDVLPFLPGAGPAVYRSCGDQGLSVGWTNMDVMLLPCQFVEMDNILEGFYVLENHVNPEHLLPESDHTNNTAAVLFHYKPKQGRFGPAIRIVE